MSGKAWQSETLIFEGDEYFDSLLDGIAHARRSIELESYIFEMDSIGLRVIGALKRAAARGVEVRLLVDGFGSWRRVGQIRQILRGSPICFKVYHSVGLPLLGSPGRWLARLNRRDHRKVCVIDGARAWVGSFNISDVHCESLGRGPAWRDTGAVVTGSGVGRIRLAFNRAWFPRWPFARITRHSVKGIRLNDSPAARRAALKELLWRISGARHRVWLTTPYFVPTRKLLRALRHAASRGVDVRLLVPGHSDVPGMMSVARTYFKRLIFEDISVFFYQPAMLHAKVVLVDDWATVGSSNLNHRSLLHDLEIDLVLRSPNSLRELTTRFNLDLAHSVLLSSASVSRWSWLDRIVGALGVGLRYWL